MLEPLPTDARLCASILAHEVNKAASAVLISAEAALRWLDKSPADVERAKKSLGLLIRNTERICEIVDRSRDTWSLFRAVRVPVNVNHIANDTLSLMSSDIADASIRVERDFCQKLQLISADRAQLEHVFSNLIANSIEAIRATKDRARYLRVGTYQVDQGGVLIAIEDSGEPISTHEADHIFDFLHTTKPHGTGIGLAISRAIIDNHGGRIWARRNDWGEGSTFRMILPGIGRASAEAADGESSAQ
ncbi:Sensor histidine kinase [Neorhizobium galegae bv. orientalis]|nr:Sensor histidine kinase [Neorhizobium galegae bv. orientalis]